MSELTPLQILVEQAAEAQQTFSADELEQFAQQLKSKGATFATHPRIVIVYHPKTNQPSGCLEIDIPDWMSEDEQCQFAQMHFENFCKSAYLDWRVMAWYWQTFI